MKWKIAVCVALAAALQSSLSTVWRPFAYADLALIVVVYFALQRDAVPTCSRAACSARAASR
jgi:hypothetical protein